ncbi:MvaI/BcnI family restriction endonuclease [Shimazuella kribbensis]|uniref:MvaI/BcnI family restriction endonuclease n=1 Tax=Shimazuella kribbensis TaxID=139808 RepID=UPI00040A0130|nr:MvaI/BcnI family restriction endonuclease [Shimazuella kribbensis]
MNAYFLPNTQEQNLIQIIQKYCRNEFTLIRMTETMLKKSIIDASEGLRVILKENDIIDYDTLTQGEKEYRQITIISPAMIEERQVSLYRPKTKQGDPRFWIYSFKSIVNSGDLVYFTVYSNKLVAIPLLEHECFEESIRSFFGDYDDTLVEELRKKISILKGIGWIESISPHKPNPKDAGLTLEKALGVKPNNLITADYMGKIELKTKRLKTKNMDTLFSKAPDWDISKITKAADMMLRYGYSTARYPDFYDLYVTVKNTPNNQGLFLGVDEEKQLVHQKYLMNGQEEDTCNWRFSGLKERLLAKHPKTMWLLVDEEIIDGKIHFKYVSVQLTQSPIFNQFTSLIQQGIVTYDWRGRVKSDGTGYKDKGHCFRMKPRDRHLLFGEVKDLPI